MLVESLLGSLIGGAFRLAPEILKWLDRKHERAHELALFDKQLEADKFKGAQRIDELTLQADMAQMAGGLTALQEALKGQFQRSGVKFIDAMNVSVRPVVTYSFFALYALTKVAVFIAAMHSGSGWVEAVKPIWTDADMALWSAILNFYFLGRVFDKRG